MRPVRLEVQAFGPYSNREIVDFDDLIGDGLFLIHGPTGAGKSALLDAIAYALFGRLTGGRTAEAMRSDHSPAELPTEVCLEFCADGDRWRVERRPPHERPKVRGQGTRTDTATARLFKREGADWKTVAKGSHEVGREVTELVGLTHEQFTRVILLPQGQFQRVLRPATAREREELLTSLFDTELFGAVESWAKDRWAEASAAVASDDRHLDHLRRQADERAIELSAHDVDVEESDTASIHDQDSFDLVAQELRRRAGDAASLAERTRQKVEVLGQENADAEVAAQRWARRSRLQADRRRLAALGPEVDELHERLTRARNAEPTRSASEVALAAIDELRRARATMSSAEESLVAATRGLSAPTTHIVTTATAHRHESAAWSNPADIVAATAADADRVLSGIAAATARLDELGSLAGRRADLTKRRVQLGRAADDAGRRASAASAAADAAERTATEIGSRLELDRITASHLDVAIEATERAQVVARSVRLLITARAEATRADEAAQIARAAHLDAKETHLRVRERYIDGIAATLADDLTDGDACPVCGSEDHPSPATRVSDDHNGDHHGDADPGTPPRREDVDRLMALQDETESAWRRSVEVAEAAHRHASEVSGRTDGITDTAVADDAVVRSKARLNEVRQAADRSAEAEQRVGRLRSQVADHSELAGAARLEAERILGELKSIDTEIQRCDEALTAALGIAAPVDDALGQAARDLDSLAGAVRDLADGSRRHDAAVEASAAASEQLSIVLDRSGFSTADEARSALLDPATVADLERRVRDHRDRVAGVAAQLGSDDLADLPDETPDVEASRLALSTARSAFEHARATEERTRSAADAIARWSDQHRALQLRSEPARRDEAVLRRLSDTLNGRSGSKVSLRRWVLAAFLTDVCDLANVRLRAMTGGRYTLSVHRGDTPGNRAAGLDLRVFDAHTGEDRDVSTLSGGETFQASLALALAVADAVQQHSGGIRMDALFIDEGFGTLDADALELAMDELDALRAGGRMVGVISHVGTMRERIQRGISVIPSADGSRLSVGSLA